MAIAELLQALREEAEAEVEQIRARTSEEITALTLAAEEEREEQRRRHLLAEREAALRDQAQRKALAEEEGLKAEVLRTREGLLDQVLAALEEELASLEDDPRYLEALRKDLAEALEYSAGAPATVSCDRRTLALLEEGAAGQGTAAQRLGLPPEVGLLPADDLGPGFRLQTADGRMAVDATLAARARAQRPLLAREILRLLSEAEKK